MPRKKKRKEKTREYLENLLDKENVTDRAIARSIAIGLNSDNSTERVKALELAARLRGFADADKKVGEDIEPLPITNITIEDMEKLTNRCHYCIHGKFESKFKNADNNIAGEATLPADASDTNNEPNTQAETDN